MIWPPRLAKGGCCLLARVEEIHKFQAMAFLRRSGTCKTPHLMPSCSVLEVSASPEWIHSCALKFGRASADAPSDRVEPIGDICQAGILTRL
jgi:hypothetical protein